MSQQDRASASREERFVEYVLAGIQKDKGLAARLRRADNPATEFQSWDVLAGFGIDLENAAQRLSYATVAAAMARAKAAGNGNMRLGEAIAACYGDVQDSQAQTKLRRVLTCDNVPELCRILRPVLTLIESRIAGMSLDYARLLRQMSRFAWDAQAVRAEWAQEFYGRVRDTAGREAP